MSGTLTEPSSIEADNRGGSFGPTAIAIVCAVVVTGLVFAGYAYLRKRHVQQTIASAESSAANVQKGPARAQIFIDDAVLKGGQTTVGGTIKNISGYSLSQLSVDLELHRRKNGATELRSVPVQPEQLEPQQEGRYSLTLSAQDYSSVKLASLKSGGRSLVYRGSPGQKRPPERLEGKTVFTRPAPHPGEFLNSPDDPARLR